MNPYQKIVEAFARTPWGAKVARDLATVIDRRLLRWSKGRISSGIGTTFGKSICLLTAKGAKSGEMRTVPLLFTKYGDDVLLVASKGGDEGNPAWYFNLKAHPECEVEIHGVRTKRLAKEADASERDTLWKAAVANYPGYADYQKRVTRTIPVMRLVPR